MSNNYSQQGVSQQAKLLNKIPDVMRPVEIIYISQRY